MPCSMLEIWALKPDDAIDDADAFAGAGTPRMPDELGTPAHGLRIRLLPSWPPMHDRQRQDQPPGPEFVLEREAAYGQIGFI